MAGGPPVPPPNRSDLGTVRRILRWVFPWKAGTLAGPPPGHPARKGNLLSPWRTFRVVPVQASWAGDESVSLPPEIWPEAPRTPAFSGGWTHPLQPGLGWWVGREGLREGGAQGCGCGERAFRAKAEAPRSEFSGAGIGEPPTWARTFGTHTSKQCAADSSHLSATSTAPQRTMNNTFPHSPSLSFFPPSALLSSLLLPPYPSFLPPLFLSYLYYMLCSDNFGWT